MNNNPYAPAVFLQRARFETDGSAEAMLSWLAARASLLEGLAEDLMGALRDLRDDGGCCPDCGAFLGSGDTEPHSPNCSVEAALAKYREAPG